MNNLPFDKPGRFYRGNLHCHSTRSDGTLDPAAMVAAYRTRGYHFLAVTDHFKEQFGYPVTDTRHLRTDDFTTLIGTELFPPPWETGTAWETIAVGLPVDFAPPRTGETIFNLTQRAAAAGAFIGIAHPAGYAMTVADALAFPDAHAIEVRNTLVHRCWDHGEAWYLSDMMGNAGRRHTAFASDDAHFKFPGEGFDAWVEVRSEALDPDLILAALKAGRYYASEGPEIRDIGIAGGEIRVACSPARAVAVSGTGVRKHYHFGEGITGHAFPLDLFTDSFCRVTVIDAMGRRAWSNPIWLA